MNFDDLLNQPLPSKEDSFLEACEPTNGNSNDESEAEKKKKLKKKIITTTVAISSLIVIATSLLKIAQKNKDKNAEKRITENLKNLKNAKNEMKYCNTIIAKLDKEKDAEKLKDLNSRLKKSTSVYEKTKSSLSGDAKYLNKQVGRLEKTIQKKSTVKNASKMSDKTANKNATAISKLMDKLSAVSNLRDMATVECATGENIGDAYDWGGKENYELAVSAFCEAFCDELADDIIEESGDVIDLLDDDLYFEASNEGEDPSIKAEKKKLRRKVAIISAAIASSLIIAVAVKKACEKRGDKNGSKKVAGIINEINQLKKKANLVNGMISDRVVNGQDIKQKSDLLEKILGQIKTLEGQLTREMGSNMKLPMFKESFDACEEEYGFDGNEVFESVVEIIYEACVEKCGEEACAREGGCGKEACAREEREDYFGIGDNDDPDDLTDDELSELDMDLSDETLDALIGDVPEENLSPDEERLADDMMGSAATSELIRSEMNAEERTNFIESTFDVESAINEGLMLESDVIEIANELGLDYTTEGKNYGKKMIIRLDKESKMKQLYAVAINVSAAAHHDPDYEKYKKVMKMRKILRMKMRKKYHSEALKRMKVYYKRLTSSKSNVLSALGKKLAGKSEK